MLKDPRVDPDVVWLDGVPPKIINLLKEVEGMPGPIRVKYLNGEITKDQIEEYGLGDFKDFGFFKN